MVRKTKDEEMNADGSNERKFDNYRVILLLFIRMFVQRGPETASFDMKPDENLKLRIFIDGSVVKVFVNGKQCVAARVDPSREDAVGVSIRS